MYGLKGPNLAIVTACTTGLHCIGAAGRLIEYGDADMMIAAVRRRPYSPLGLGGFAAARALSARERGTRSRLPAPGTAIATACVLGEGQA